MTSLQAWRDEQAEEITRREREVEQRLGHVIPKSFDEWYSESGFMVVKNLIEYGMASPKYRRDEGEIYGYTDLEEFARRFDELRAVWEGVVGISISWDGDYRFEVTFRPL